MAWDGAVVIEIIGGREGKYGIRNSNLVPIGGLLRLRNATLEDGTWRTGGGASQLGDAVDAALTLQRAIDYFPSIGTQRTLVYASDG